MRFVATMLLSLLGCSMAAAAAHAAESPQDVLARSQPSDWHTIDPDNVLVMQLPAGRVVLELAPQFAPLHVANIRLLARQHYFDGLDILRVQDNYVVQWGDPDDKRSLGGAAATLTPEFSRPLVRSAPFHVLVDGDVYAPQVGFIDSWPVARDPKHGQEWLTHCYGMLGTGRDNSPESGAGSELYVVIGHAPRHLDRNVTLVGRVIQGIELLSALPRGTGNLGFYEKPDQFVPISAVRVESDQAAEQRPSWQELRTNTPLFTDYVNALRSRKSSWFVEPTNRVELCNVKVPVRMAP